MTTLLAESIEAGGLGFSSSQSRTHSDGDGNPISSRFADRREMLAFCEVVRDHPGTTLEYITNGCLDTFSDDEIDLMVAMTTTARAAPQLEPADRRLAHAGQDHPPARGVGGGGGRRGEDHRPDHADPGAHEHELPHPLRPVPHPRLGRRHGTARRAADRAAEATPRCGPGSTSSPTPRTPASSAASRTGPTTSSATRSPPRTPATAGATSGSIAEEQGKEPFDALLDLVIADDLRTVLWPKASDGDAASWEARVDVWNDPGALVGGSDAGAHLDRMCGSNYPTSFLGDCLRNRKLVPMEQAVHWMTQAARRPVRPPRPGPGGRGPARRPLRLRPRRRWPPSRPPWSRTCPAAAPA